MMKFGLLVLGLLVPTVSALLVPTWPVASDAPRRRDQHARDLDLQQMKNHLKVRTREEEGDARGNMLHNFKRAADVRLSFKECNLDPGMREDCGYFGMSEVDCYRRGCCYGETETEEVPWCYHSKPTQIPQCVLDSHERNECGSYGITKEECMAKQCCWRPSTDVAIPWCFYYRSEPVFEGECGVPPISPVVTELDRVVGGTEAREHSWPWTVSLQNSRGHFCGGSLINDQWVLSAAHCERGLTRSGDGKIVVGMHSRTEQAQFQRTVDIDKIIPHPGYDARAHETDLMLLKLSEKIELGETIQPVCLPGQGERVPVGTHCYTIGWGTVEFLGERPDKLQQVMNPVIAEDTCNQESWYNGRVTDNMICAGYQQGGRGACHGDSGGPMVCYMDDHWILHGIVNWGGVCAWEETPAVYARVSNFATWVERTVFNDQ